MTSTSGVFIKSPVIMAFEIRARYIIISLHINDKELVVWHSYSWPPEVLISCRSERHISPFPGAEAIPHPGPTSPSDPHLAHHPGPWCSLHDARFTVFHSQCQGLTPCPHGLTPLVHSDTSEHSRLGTARLILQSGHLPSPLRSH